MSPPRTPTSTPPEPDAITVFHADSTWRQIVKIQAGGWLKRSGTTTYLNEIPIIDPAALVEAYFGQVIDDVDGALEWVSKRGVQ